MPPRTEAEVHVFGPPLASLGEKTTLGLFLYDVVTQTDAAGNITGKENFEWYYSYMSEPISKQVAQKVEYIQQPIGATTLAPQQPQRRRH